MRSIPFSRLVGTRHVGPRFFERVGATDVREVRGLCDDLGIHARADLDIAAVDGRIRRFYEDTASFDLLVRPAWTRPFLPAARLWKALSRSIGQMEMPLQDERAEDRITSRLLALRQDVDGRPSPRAWVRTYGDGRAMYVAAYSTHCRDGIAYMNIAFPVPLGNLTSILRMDAIPHGIVLSSVAGGDSGIFFAGRRLRFRVPLRETIRVWPVDAPDLPLTLRTGVPPATTVVARHDMWLCGLRYLTLDYFIFPGDEM